MVADRTKKAKTEEKSEDDNKNENGPLNEELILSIEKLQEIQEELEKINEEASDKVLEVEQKYNEERKPVYEKRNEIIKSIPDFWLTAFLSHPVLGNLLTDEEQKIFKHLTAMEVEDNKDIKSGFSITFKFESNPYFENDKLTKTFTFSSEGTTKVNSTPIQWKEGMGPPKEASTEKKGKKRALPEESFFVWFSNNEVKDAVDDMQDEIVEIIKEDLWPNPLAYFNSEEGDFDGDEGDEGDNDGDDSDGEEDDDENGDDGEDDEENDDDEEDAE